MVHGASVQQELHRVHCNSIHYHVLQVGIVMQEPEVEDGQLNPGSRQWGAGVAQQEQTNPVSIVQPGPGDSLSNLPWSGAELGIQNSTTLFMSLALDFHPLWPWQQTTPHC